MVQQKWDIVFSWTMPVNSLHFAYEHRGVFERHIWCSGVRSWDKVRLRIRNERLSIRVPQTWMAVFVVDHHF